MLEAAILLEMALGKYFVAAIIAGLLVFNAALGFAQVCGAEGTRLRQRVQRYSLTSMGPIPELEILTREGCPNTGIARGRLNARCGPSGGRRRPA